MCGSGCWTVNVRVLNSISIAFLLPCSKALSSYRQIRRKYREQVWRLEQKVAAMAESQQQSEAHRAAPEASEWRREETVLWPWESSQIFIHISSWPTVLISYSGTFMTGAGQARRRFAGLLLSFATVGDEMELKFKKWTENWIILNFGFVMGQDGRFKRLCNRLILCFTCEHSLIIPNMKSSIAGSIVCTLN